MNPNQISPCKSISLSETKYKLIEYHNQECNISRKFPLEYHEENGGIPIRQ